METALKQKMSLTLSLRKAKCVLQEEAGEYFTEEFLGDDEDKYDDWIDKMNLHNGFIKSLLDELGRPKISFC